MESLASGSLLVSCQLAILFPVAKEGEVGIAEEQIPKPNWRSANSKVLPRALSNRLKGVLENTEVQQTCLLRSTGEAGVTVESPDRDQPAW